MPSVTGIYHGGITVSDMDRSLRFYAEGLGLPVEFDVVAADRPYLREVLALDFSAMRIVYLRLPGSGATFIELLEYRGLERHPASARPQDPGAGHLCLFVDDVEEMHDRLTAMGYRSRSPKVVDITAGVNLGARSCYMADPDGYLVELFQRPPAPWSLDIDAQARSEEGSR